MKYKIGEKVQLIKDVKQNKIIDYVIMIDADEDYLRTNVKGALDEEWSLYGFPFASEGYFCQAMVRYKNNKESRHTSKGFLVGQWVRLNSGPMEGSFGRIVSHYLSSCLKQAAHQGRRYLVEIPGCKTSSNYHWLVEENSINLINDNLSVINYKNQ